MGRGLASKQLRQARRGTNTSAVFTEAILTGGKGRRLNRRQRQQMIDEEYSTGVYHFAQYRQNMKTMSMMIEQGKKAGVDTEQLRDLETTIKQMKRSVGEVKDKVERCSQKELTKVEYFDVGNNDVLMKTANQHIDRDKFNAMCSGELGSVLLEKVMFN